MQSLVIRSAAAALFAFALVPAAFAQPAGRSTAEGFYATAARAPVCTRMELRAGLTGEKCGQLTVSELESLKVNRDNGN